MPAEIITPRDEQHWLELRRPNINSTDIGAIGWRDQSGAIIDLSPYLTHFELWHQKNGTLPTPDFKDSERVQWGRKFEDAIANAAAEENGWAIRPMKDYAVIAGERIGSSFDYMVKESGRGPGLLEVKNVDAWVFKKGWTEGEDPEAPAHIELQLQHQLEVLDLSWGAIVAMVGGNRMVVIERDRDEEVGRGIRAAVREFWRSVAAGEEPEPDFQKDADAVIRMHGTASDRFVDLSANNRAADLAATYKDASAREKLAGREKDAAKAELLTLIGDAGSARVGDYKISAGMVAAGRVEYERKAHRTFRINGGGK